MTRAFDRPFDAGLQAERTALAWQRTVLSFAIAALVSARLLLNTVSIGSYAVAALGLIMTAVLFWVGHRRYRAVHTTLVQASTDRIRLASAAPLFLWALAVFVLAVVGAVFAALGIVATLPS
ncbi:uncharacterized protein DUF202 [Salinibacterium amurskyense]|uniref:Uncharacterized protein DUF202 n=1 Tax=Salinibacterium amurskyense TaxID=205941 RepID=A0A2M9D2T8_9MICO|nr:DUF202 domain-containing protein [Salinibacterium amurskyense]PJJ78500.1 uncharacterized protein DUF202 [Salinibacterium amurskyense]RLQ80594.1 DUF202 domain-containing protein [Salinibacterium amurskyense]GHD83127.1 hypothetical protein GCM10007394_21720 [Salinibacterium amurskyense]